MLENVKGTVKLWVNEWKRTPSDDAIKLFNITISNKQTDGTYINASLPVSFASSVDTSEFTNGVEIDIINGWLTAQAAKPYNKIRLFVNEAVLTTVNEDDNLDDAKTVMITKLSAEIEKTKTALNGVKLANDKKKMTAKLTQLESELKALLGF